jgi:hypothetical protein
LEAHKSPTIAPKWRYFSTTILSREIIVDCEAGGVAFELSGPFLLWKRPYGYSLPFGESQALSEIHKWRVMPPNGIFQWNSIVERDTEDCAAERAGFEPNPRHQAHSCAYFGFFFSETLPFALDFAHLV